MDCQFVIWKRHALERMMERGITRFEVKSAIEQGQIIETYADDYPAPSVLILAIIENRPIHVVVAKEDENCFVITAYQPGKDHFESDWKTRK